MKRLYGLIIAKTRARLGMICLMAGAPAREAPIVARPSPPQHFLTQHRTAGQRRAAQSFGRGRVGEEPRGSAQVRAGRIAYGGVS